MKPEDKMLQNRVCTPSSERFSEVKKFNQSDGAVMLFSRSNYQKVRCYQTLLWQCNANSSCEIASFWTVFTFVFRWKYKRCNTCCLRADSALRIKEVQYTQVIGLNRKTNVLHITPLFNYIFLKGQKVVGENLTVKSKQSMTPIIRYVTLQMPITNCELNKKSKKITPSPMQQACVFVHCSCTQ